MNLKCGLQRILKNLALILFGTNQNKLHRMLYDFPFQTPLLAKFLISFIAQKLSEPIRQEHSDFLNILIFWNILKFRFDGCGQIYPCMDKIS